MFQPGLRTPEGYPLVMVLTTVSYDQFGLFEHLKNGGVPGRIFSVVAHPNSDLSGRKR